MRPMVQCMVIFCLVAAGEHAVETESRETVQFAIAKERLTLDLALDSASAAGV
ncbi:MAG: hypothetical protein H0V34_02015 [Gammaproteobacteria bacterium]|nr:hypothetical protein [Gammaproteobacteria bacterium]